MALRFVKGLTFDEPFFNAVIKRAGGHRLLDLHVPPPNKQNVDYLIKGFALELKILTTDPLDSPERQAKLERFFKAEFPKGPLWVTATKREAMLTGALAKKYWEWYMAAPLQDRLDTASSQIADTHTYVPGLIGGGVILVNVGGSSLDWQSFVQLTNHHQERFASINIVFALNSIPTLMENGEFQLHSGIIAKTGYRDKASELEIALSTAIGAEISERTAKTTKTVEVDVNARSGKVKFQLTSSGVRRKPPP